MKRILFIILLFLPSCSTVAQIEHKDIFSVFLHSKCHKEKMTTVLVIENNTPYRLTVDNPGQVNDSEIENSLFSLIDIEKYHQMLAGEKYEKPIIVRLDYSRTKEILVEKVEFLPFEKKVYFKYNILNGTTLNSSKAYSLTVAGVALNVTFSDGALQLAVLPEVGHIIPDNCY